MTDAPPKMILKRTACPRCGARTAQQAETRCRPTRGIDDEWTCPSGDRTDAQGWFIAETTESINRWVDWQVAQDAKKRAAQ